MLHLLAFHSLLDASSHILQMPNGYGFYWRQVEVAGAGQEEIDFPLCLKLGRKLFHRHPLAAK